MPSWKTWPLSEKRLRFNEKARKHLGSWATLDMHLAVEEGINVSGLILGGFTAHLLARNLNADDSTVTGAIVIGSAIGYVAGKFISALYADYQREHLHLNRGLGYFRLVGVKNVLHHGSQEVREFREREIPCFGKEIYDRLHKELDDDY
jgi:hypothetical protein